MFLLCYRIKKIDLTVHGFVIKSKTQTRKPVGFIQSCPHVVRGEISYPFIFMSFHSNSCYSISTLYYKCVNINCFVINSSATGHREPKMIESSESLPSGGPPEIFAFPELDQIIWLTESDQNLMQTEGPKVLK